MKYISILKLGTTVIFEKTKNMKEIQKEQSKKKVETQTKGHQYRIFLAHRKQDPGLNHSTLTNYIYAQ